MGEMVHQVMRIADVQLKLGGSMIAKYFEGFDKDEILEEMRKRYESARLIRVDATRTQSPEVYVVGTGKKVTAELMPALWSRPERPKDTSAPVQVQTDFNGW